MQPIVYDPEAGEHGLVELPTHFRWCAEVEPVCVGAQQQRFVHHAEHGIYLGRAAFYGPLRSSQFSRDAFLFAFEQVERDGVGVAGLKQLEALVFKGSDSFVLALQFALVLSLEAGKAVYDVGSNLIGLVFGELHPQPPVRHRDLDVGDQHR